VSRVRHLRVALGLLVALAPNAAAAAAQDAPATEPAVSAPGSHVRRLSADGRERSYVVHVPKTYDATKPAAVVLALHGAGMNGSMMEWFSGLDRKSEQAGFVVVYPSGTGTGPFLTWNAGGLWARQAEGRPDDVAFLGKVLDDVEAVLKVDARRVYACGMSNGAMMCYRLAAEMSDRIAAVAPVAGTIAVEASRPGRAVPVMHIHGTKDPLVPFEVPAAGGRAAGRMRFKAVGESIQTWVKLDGCRAVAPTVEVISKEGDEMRVTRTTYGGGRDGAEVVLVTVEGGGHTWPGQPAPVGFIGKSAMNVSANDLIWEFFKRHPLK